MEEEVHSCGGGRVFSSEEHRAIGGAIERLGLQFLENLPISPQQPNVVLSPLSLALALAQLTLGQSQSHLQTIRQRLRRKVQPGVEPSVNAQAEMY